MSRRRGGGKNASADELANTKALILEELDKGMTQVRGECARQAEPVQAAVDNVKQRIASCESQVADMAQTTEKTAALLEQRFQHLSEEVQTIRTAFKEQLQQVQCNMSARLEAVESDSTAKIESISNAMMMAASQQSASGAVKFAGITAVLREQQREFISSMEGVRRDLYDQEQRIQAFTEQRLSEFDCANQRALKEQDQLQQKHMELTSQKLDELGSHMADEAAKHNMTQADLQSSTDTKVVKLRDDLERRLLHLENGTQQLGHIVSEVANIPTRRAEWIIQDVQKRLRPPSATSSHRYRSLFSPTFEAAGARNLQLEIRLFKPEDTEQATEDAGHGDVALCVWANPGLELVFKLDLGSSSVQFHHTFEDQTPCVTNRLCFIGEQINQADGSLRVGIDVLEAIRTVDTSLQQQQQQQQHCKKADVDIDAMGEATNGTTNSHCRRPVFDSAIVLHRYVNHRTLDLVQDQVQLMRSRMVRRIEWRIEQASILPRCFPIGESICSSTFEAAGVDGLQLVFYPSGYSGAREGFCSFFLRCPTGAHLRCCLWAGKQRREARHEFEQSGFFGRTNFCRFDSSVDITDDTVPLALEIEEAQQNVTESLSHKPTSVQQLRPQTAPDVVNAQEKIDSSMKLRRAAGNVALEDVKLLPSIWTSRPQGDITQALDGFHSFNELKVKKPHTARRPSRPCSVGCRTRTPGISCHADAGLPAPVPQRFSMYAA